MQFSVSGRLTRHAIWAHPIAVVSAQAIICASAWPVLGCALSSRLGRSVCPVVKALKQWKDEHDVPLRGSRSRR